MSPYGASAGGSAVDAPLAPRLFALPSVAKASLAVVHLTRASLPSELEAYLREVRLTQHIFRLTSRQIFNATVRDGRTYPQEHELDEDTFAAYYLAADLFVGVWVARDESLAEAESRELPSDTTLSSLVAGRPWADAVVGMYCASRRRQPAH